MVLISTHGVKAFAGIVVAQRESDDDIVRKFIQRTRRQRLAVVAKMIDRDEGTVQRLRTAVKHGRPVGGVRADALARMRDYLFATGEPLISGYQDGVRAALREMRDKLDEMEMRLSPPEAP